MIKNEIMNLFDDTNNDNMFSSMNIPDIMRSDIYEIEDKIMIEVELPGYEKQDVEAQLYKGYLTIMATKSKKIEKNPEKREYIQRERYLEGSKRTYYVGCDICQENVHAALSNGILTVMIDKPQNAIEDNRKMIEIH